MIQSLSFLFDRTQYRNTGVPVDRSASTARSHTTSSNVSSIDDVSSLCDQVHFRQSLRDVSVGSTRTQSEFSNEDQLSTEEGLFGSKYGMGRRLVESSRAPSGIRKGKEVVFDSKQDVQEVEVDGTNRGHEKKGKRGTTNLWRKYGALRKLKTVGGYAPKDYKDSKGRNFEFFSEKSRLPAPPPGPELTLNRDKKYPSVVACVIIGDKPAVEEALLVAKEIDSMVTRMSLDDYINVKKEHGKKKNTVASKLNRSGVSGLFRRLSGTNSKRNE
uniref:Uncharacterized protein n=1 Tax=Pristionchus pacificus TaxID=54126 RepID=A0A8R1Z874_PRIPA